MVKLNTGDYSVATSIVTKVDFVMFSACSCCGGSFETKGINAPASLILKRADILLSEMAIRQCEQGFPAFIACIAADGPISCGTMDSLWVRSTFRNPVSLGCRSFEILRSGWNLAENPLSSGFTICYCTTIKVANG
jgi:hypothetical protein